jgi:pimeloyl-ACP methyl ester carboxylesterase
VSDVPEAEERSQVARPGKDGKPSFQWTLTDSGITDTVKLIAGPFDVLPVIFVPGIMGSNLKSKETGEPVWLLNRPGFPGSLGPAAVSDAPMNTLMLGYIFKSPGDRQRLLHPDRVEVYDQGSVPGSGSVKEEYLRKGWGTVAEPSYQDFLLWLEKTLNPFPTNPALWPEYYQDQATISAPPKPGDIPRLTPGIRMGLKGQPFGAEKQFDPLLTDNMLARSKFYCPVYACGYNWLASNRVAAGLLKSRIEEVIHENNGGMYRCKQVVLITHSMGGLVARACAELSGMQDKIAGVIHGVMPATGAAVAYRRCKVGMKEEGPAGLVIGNTGRDVTAVFSQAPGALQLLPSHTYLANWLKVSDANGKILMSLPAGESGRSDPYQEIYLRRDRWWGLLDPQWLNPEGGRPISWNQFEMNISLAKGFHENLIGKYHVNSFVYFGADEKQKSFEKINWKLSLGRVPDNKVPPTAQEVLQLASTHVRMDGTNPEYVGGKTEIYSTGRGAYTVELSYWVLRCEMQDGIGDGTVPLSSGSAPLAQGGSNIQQQFRLSGFGHEPSFKDNTVRKAVLYSFDKIATKAKRPE